ncbi:MAG: GMC family oxidoreductase [Saprospiraceae bacterium]|nr:GMC family oxidoreductase [Saprospiraceae bacterium]
MNINLQSVQQNTYDAIVVGSGISGGWAAKELCEKGLKTLVLERGRMVRHIADYPTMNWDPWDLPYGDQLTPREIAEDYPVQHRTAYAVRQSTKHFFVNDRDHPYIQKRPFTWMRGNHVGGKSLMWARWAYRWSDYDFDAPARDGVGIDWPIRYRDLAPWYDYVESYIGVSGERDGIPQTPDGKFLPPWEMNCIEKHVKQKIAEHYSDRMLAIGRSANITKPHGGRGACMARNLCERGCPYGAYFSSNVVTLPAAEATGNMTLRPHSIVHTILYDKDRKKASGVRIVDAQTKESMEFYGKVIFLCASALASTAILLRSVKESFPDGLGNTSGELGHNVMDNHFRVGAYGQHDGYTDLYYKGRRPVGVLVPRFQNLDGKTRRKDYLRGFVLYGFGSRRGYWRNEPDAFAFGADYKDRLTVPGPWTFNFLGFGECLPNHDNRIYLDYDQLDPWELPKLVMDVAHGENEMAMRKEMQSASAEMLEVAGFKNITTYDEPSEPGLSIHEMGSARMGRDPKTSVLNRWNQMHDVPNVFATDGSGMCSDSWGNPSLTFMAMTARACDYAIKELNKRNL